MPRVFFSFPVPKPYAAEVHRSLPRQLPVVWYPPQNLHVTLWFVGEVAEAAIPQLAKTASALAADSSPFSFTPQAFHVVDRRLRLVFESAAAAALHEALGRALVAAQLSAPDPRPYHPHITLGRPRSQIGAEAMPQPNLAPFAVSEFGLYLSEPGEHHLGSYTLLHHFPFGNKTGFPQERKSDDLSPARTHSP